MDCAKVLLQQPYQYLISDIIKQVVDTLDMEDLGDKAVLCRYFLELHAYRIFSILHSQMLEIQEVSILRWIPCQAQQSHW